MQEILLPLITPSIAPSPSEKGETGYGEGFTIPKNNKLLSYHYRFAGKAIPRDKVTYVTAEDGYFSRTRGERYQLIIAYDSNAEGFRILESVSPNSGDFKASYDKFRALSAEKAIEIANNEAIENKRFRDELQAEIERGADLF